MSILGTNSTNNGVNGHVYALAMNGTNNLFVGGSFTSVDGSSISANYITSWDGNSWNILGSNSTNNGVNGWVHALAMNGTNNLFVGGAFSSVNGGSILPIISYLGMEIYGIYWDQIQQLMELE